MASRRKPTSQGKPKRPSSDTAALNASLPTELRAWVDERVARGGFGTASEYIRSLIREDRERAGREDRLERKFLEDLSRGGRAGEDDGAGRRLREAFDMLRLTFDMMRANLRREHPAASAAEIDRRIEEWKKEDESSHEVPGHIVRSEERLRRYLGARP